MSGKKHFGGNAKRTSTMSSDHKCQGACPAMQETDMGRLQVAAHGGCPAAQYALGTRLTFGIGVSATPEEGVGWLRKSADQGCPYAMMNLARACGHGVGVPVDEKLAVQLCLRAAECGAWEAQLTLGQAYYFGVEGFPLSRRKAEKWFRAAAEQGSEDAQDMLDQHYAAGNGKARGQGKTGRGIRRAVGHGIHA